MNAVTRSFGLHSALILAATCLFASSSQAQRGSAGPPAAPPTTTSAALPPATKMEAFVPAAGTVYTFGYNELGVVGAISVDAREIRDVRGTSVRGLVVDISQGDYRREKAFIDADEIPELLKGIDALLDVRSNPTSFEQFEVHYKTRGGLDFTAFNMKGGAVSYSALAGRTTTARASVDEKGLRSLREMFLAGQNKLLSLGAK